MAVLKGSYSNELLLTPLSEDLHSDDGRGQSRSSEVLCDEPGARSRRSRSCSCGEQDDSEGDFFGEEVSIRSCSHEEFSVEAGSPRSCSRSPRRGEEPGTSSELSFRPPPEPVKVAWTKQLQRENGQLKPLHFVSSESFASLLTDGDDAAESHAAAMCRQAESVEAGLAAEQLEKLYGIGSKIMFKLGHVVGQSLGESASAWNITTCLRSSRKHASARGLGFASSRAAYAVPDVLQFRVGPPKCTRCKQARWPAWKSRKGRWHCGPCHSPAGGRPRCFQCATLTWDGWPGPLTHGREWWCRSCWCTHQDHGSDEWENWFKMRMDKYPEQFENDGPEIFPTSKKKKRKKQRESRSEGDARLRSQSCESLRLQKTESECGHPEPFEDARSRSQSCESSRLRNAEAEYRRSIPLQLTPRRLPRPPPSRLLPRPPPGKPPLPPQQQPELQPGRLFDMRILPNRPKPPSSPPRPMKRPMPPSSPLSPSRFSALTSLKASPHCSQKREGSCEVEDEDFSIELEPQEIEDSEEGSYDIEEEYEHSEARTFDVDETSQDEGANCVALEDGYSSEPEVEHAFQVEEGPRSAFRNHDLPEPEVEEAEDTFGIEDQIEEDRYAAELDKMLRKLERGQS
eukprot:TRINITY_DN9096_c0_g1_i1.p1 TRINITY_DN9096_c0_g1~~TRINITY_DN9096_c0_g1_i1.p1  ORF type:complete len:627 (-),score=126.42 TRINITY_DN9096_c0_g1_i1:77-1957(-)